MSFFLFPGQGSQSPGMGQDFYEGSPVARETLDEAEAVLGEGFLESIFNGTVEALQDTRLAQPALVAVEVAIARHLISVKLSPSGCAGHSIGEISALTIAECIQFPDALRLTSERARVMSEDVPEGGMLAVLGLDPAAIEAALPPGAEIANLNGPSQTIISGPAAVMDATTEALKYAGAKRVIALPVSGPFHSSCMAAASAKFRETVQATDIRPPRTGFVSSVSGKLEAEPAQIAELLCKQIAAPVRWTEVMLSVGEVDALEVGPGNVLQGLAKRTPNAPKVRPAGKMETAETLLSTD